MDDSGPNLFVRALAILLVLVGGIAIYAGYRISRSPQKARFSGAAAGYAVIAVGAVVFLLGALWLRAMA